MKQLIKKFRLQIIILFCCIITAVAACMQLSNGSYDVSIKQIGNALIDPNIWNLKTISNTFLGSELSSKLNLGNPPEICTQTLIIWNIRLPRILVGILVGINLALAGCIFQTITQNEMASPYTLGISQGCGLTIMLILVFFPHLTAMLPVYAMVGGILSFLIVYSIAYNHGTSPVKLVLAGVILGSVTGAIQRVLFLFLSNMQTMQNAANWTLGSLIGISWLQFEIMVPWSILATCLVFCFTKPLDMLLLGDNTASSLGMSIQKWRFILSVLGILLAASSVSAVGLIGFIGLIVPHISRSLVGSSHGRLFKACVFIGPTLVVVADTVSRLLLSPTQLPIGVVTGAVGGIFFLILMKRKKHMVKL